LHIPNTTSEKAQAFLWQMPDPNLLLPLPAPNEIAQWKAVQQAAETKNSETQKGLMDPLQPSRTQRNQRCVTVLEFKPRGWKDIGKVLVYAHGSASTFQSAAPILASSVMATDRSGLHVISVDYTLAPHSEWRETIDLVVTVFAELEKQGYTTCDMALIGDSAGGAPAAGTVLPMRERIRRGSGIVCRWPCTGIPFQRPTLVDAETQLSLSIVLSRVGRFVETSAALSQTLARRRSFPPLLRL